MRYMIGAISNWKYLISQAFKYVYNIDMLFLMVKSDVVQAHQARRTLRGPRA